MKEPLHCQPGPKVILVVSTGRTGTKALAAHLKHSNENVLAVHEPAPTRSLRAPAHRFLSGQISKEVATKKLRHARRQILNGTVQGIYFESNPILSGFLEVFDDVFDSPQVLHIVRDPRTYVRSAMNFGSVSGLRALLTRTLPYWFLKPEHLDPSTRTPWSKLTDIQRLSWFWSTINRHLDQGQELFGERYRRVQFEELFHANSSTRESVFQWLGIASPQQAEERESPAKVNASHKERCPKFANWSAEQVEQFMHYCGDQMKQYGYQIDPQASTSLCSSAA